MNKQINKKANDIYEYLKEQGLTASQMRKVIEMVMVFSDKKVTMEAK
jgi:uncharacterized protein (UPF0335 family)